jgi:type I restriction enzyme S subunit
LKESTKYICYKLGDCIKLLSGGTPSKSKEIYWGGDIPWISNKDMKIARIYDSEDHITELGAKNGTHLVPAGTILIVVRGMILAKKFPVALAMREIAFNQDLKAIDCRANINSQFLFYWLQGKEYEILGLADEAAHGTKRIQTDRLINYPIKLPDIVIQRKIAAILSAYDDLIENNTRRIKILEDMAQALYREWFVNFRFPGHENVQMVDSPLGMIPEGWEVKALASFGKVVTGKTPSKKVPEYFGNYLPFIKTPDMHGNMFCIESGEMLSELGAASQNNKTIPPNSLIVSCIGTAGIVAITDKYSQTNQQINSIILKDISHREFLYFALLDLKETINQYGANGATMVNLNKGKFEALRLLVPDKKILIKFHEATLYKLDQIRILQRIQSNPACRICPHP